MVAGASWIYSLDSAALGNFTRSITAVTADGFTDQDLYDSGTSRVGQWKCDAGSLTALDSGGSSGTTANAQFAGISADFHTTVMEGVTFPAGIPAGATWSQHYIIEGTQTINGQDAASRNETTYNCTAGGTESVTVPAGTFDAVKVDCQTNTQITISGVDAPSTSNTTSTAWYASGVGMVKAVSTLTDGSTRTIELTSYSIP